MSLAIGIAEALRSGRQAFEMRRAYEREIEDRKDREQDRELRRSQIDLQRKKQAREERFETDLSEASAPLVQGGAVVDAGRGMNFAKDAGTSQFLQETAKAEAELAGTTAPTVINGAAVGNQVFANPAQAQEKAGPDGPAQQLKRQADVHLKHGKVVEYQQLSKMAKEASKEGDIEALEEAIKSRDPAKAMAAFNARGKEKVTDVRIVEDPTQKSKAYGTPALKIYGKLAGSGQEVDLLNGSNAVDHYMLLKEGLKGVFEAERGTNAEARAQAGHDAQLKNIDFQQGMAKSEAEERKRAREADVAHRDKAFDWQKKNDLFSQGIQRSNLNMNQARHKLEVDRLEAEKKAAAAGGLDLKKLESQLNRVGDVIEKANKADDLMDPAAKAEHNKKTAALSVKAQQVLLGSTMAGESMTPEMAIDAALNGAPGQTRVRDKVTGKEYTVPSIQYNGRVIRLSHSSATEAGAPAPQAQAPTTGMSPKQAARTTVSVSAGTPNSNQWTAAVGAIDQQMKAIGATIPSLSPADQVTASNEIARLNLQRTKTMEAARQQGVIFQ